jgi:hypothetical protein
MEPSSIKFPPAMRRDGQRLAREYGLSFNALVRMLLAKELLAVKTARGARRLRAA